MTSENPLPTASGVIAAITVALHSLVPSDKRVAELIVSDPTRAIELSVAEFAALASTAPSTVVHACKQLGYRGFQDLRLALARDLGRDTHTPLAEPLDDPTPAQILHRAMENSARTLMAGLKTVDPDAFTTAVGLLDKANRILVLGTGTSRAPADDIAYRLTLIGRDAFAPADAIAQHQSARRLTPNDVLLAVSHSGASRETVESADLAAEQGAPIIAITGRSTSPLIDRCTVALVAGAPEEVFRLETMGSRLAHLALATAIYTALAYADEDRAQTALQATISVDERHTV